MAKLELSDHPWLLMEERHQAMDSTPTCPLKRGTACLLRELMECHHLDQVDKGLDRLQDRLEVWG